MENAEVFTIRPADQREYDEIAEWYMTDRGRTVGVAEALAVAATLSIWMESMVRSRSRPVVGSVQPTPTFLAYRDEERRHLSR
jgi:hypothetical protein